MPCSAPLHTVTVRRARPEEFDAVGRLTFDAYAVDGFIHGESQYAEHLRNAAHRAAVAELLVAVDQADAVLGTVTYAPGGTPMADLAGAGEAEFRMLAVAPEARGCGVGAALVRACLERACRGGCRRLVLSTQPDMRTAHRLYERLGFTRTPARDWYPLPDFLLLTYAYECSSVVP